MKRIIKHLLGGLLIIFFAIQVWIFASLYWWKTHPVETTMFMRWSYYQDTSRPIVHEWRNRSEISPYLAQAIIASEDVLFTQHNGFDWHSIENALMDNHQEGEIVRGGSTISQQLNKNLFLFSERSWLRKGQEAIATVMMETLWSKDRILEVYMNSVEFGHHLYGAEAAANYYFSKSAQALTREEAAFLAAILPQPRYFQLHRHDRKLKRRQQVILRRMSRVDVP